MQDPSWLAERKHGQVKRFITQMIEVWWQHTLADLLKDPLFKKQPRKRSGGFSTYEDTYVPGNIARLLEKGPKFGIEPCIPPHELLALNRRVANKAEKEDGERCLLEGADCLLKSAPEHVRRGELRLLHGVVDYFRDNDLSLLQSDKEGGFVAMAKGTFSQKALQAINKNFRPVKVAPAKVKSSTLKLCSNLGLTKLSSSASKCKNNSLSVFFTAKTHKPDMPFRTIISEKGTWQLHVSQFLLKALNCLTVADPFLTRKSDDVIDFLRDNQSIGYMFSVDVEDLFYSIPHAELFESVTSCIDASGVIPFQNSIGMTVDNFLTLLEAYLNSTFISFDKRLYVQKKGICIGSCLAPILCNIFLAQIDQALERVFSPLLVLKVFRYVDDFLIVFSEQSSVTQPDLENAF